MHVLSGMQCGGIARRWFPGTPHSTREAPRRVRSLKAPRVAANYSCDARMRAGAYSCLSS
jgi:hypothetical protein